MTEYAKQVYKNAQTVREQAELEAEEIEKAICGRCDGEGDIELPTNNPNADHPRIIDCPKCKGLGVV